MWSYNFPPELKHYASEYYDPKKAHEYYEQHKQLKGRRTTAGLSETGKAAAAYAKSKIDEERDVKLASETERHAKEEEQRQKERQQSLENHKAVMTQRITSLNKALKRMSKADRADKAPQIKAIIDRLQKDNDKKRVEIEQKFAVKRHESSVESMKTKYNIREEANAKYESELAKIASDSSNVRQKKSSKNSGPKRTSFLS